MAKGTDFAKMILDDTILVSGNALNHAIDFIRNELPPEDVFSEDQLSKWAEANGYVKQDSNG